MHPLSIFLLGIAMSTDAFAAAVGKGAAMRAPRFRDALRVGAIFGVIEGLMPVVGWAFGIAAARHVTAWDHWIAFALLTLLGLRMIRAGTRGEDAATGADAPRRHGFWALAATGFATSIDAMAIGVGLAFLDVDIAVVAIVIGLTTLVMVTLGILLGRVLGALAGRRAEIAGGVLLIAIGAVILHEHLSGATTTAIADVRSDSRSCTPKRRERHDADGHALHGIGAMPSAPRPARRLGPPVESGCCIRILYLCGSLTRKGAYSDSAASNRLV